MTNLQVTAKNRTQVSRYAAKLISLIKLKYITLNHVK